MIDPLRAPELVCVGGVFVDDIVLPDGQTHMGVLGGGVCHAAAGAALWSKRPGIFACVGRDLPESAWARLRRDFDLRGLITLDLPQARAWQLFEWDGRRREVFRAAVMDPFVYDPQPDQLPDAYRVARGAYLLRDAAPLRAWRAVWPGAALLWEPLQQVMIPALAAEFRAALPWVDIVSPNALEAQQIYGPLAPEALVHALLNDGARLAALRLGAEGSLVGSAAGLWHVPAVPVPRVVDQTGAGNTYCGGFLAGWLATGSPCEAGCYGAAAAAFSLEATGVADPSGDWRARRDARLAWARARAERVG